ncbi:MAG: hypothetical protein HZC40_09885 [Chloroflexi bacterium]|nr:hypothetical protein [Chloroflexota bacterium]
MNDRKKITLEFGIISAAVLLAYFPALALGFYGDDWIFYDLAGRLNLSEYLVKYFDPGAQTAWYRPVQGMLWRVGNTIFGTNPLGYHLVNVLLHLANSFLILALVRRITRNARAAFFAALIFATLPTAALAVFWPGVVDTLETFFYLLATWFWFEHLSARRDRESSVDAVDGSAKQPAKANCPERKPKGSSPILPVAAFLAFLFALFSKEIGVTLPITLFLMDRFIVAQPATRAQLAKRYAPFALVLVPYAWIEYIVTRRSVFVNREGYDPGIQIAQNLADYLGTLAFPWIASPPFNYIALALGAGLLAYLIVAKKWYALLPALVGAALAILPVAPFPFVANRFLYLPLVASAILLALGIDRIAGRVPRVWSAFALIVGVALFGSVNIARAASEFAENGRVARVPFRNIRQAHPTLPDDTYFYFFNPPVPGANLSGMMLWYYGARVSARATDDGRPANLRARANAFVIYWDAQDNQKEQRVEKDIAARMSPAPTPSTGLIQLAGYELVRANLKRGEPVLGLLYLRVTDHFERVIHAEARLIAPDGRAVASAQKIIAGLGKLGELTIAPFQLPLEVEPGSYRLEISITTLPEKISIDPIVIAE